MKAVQTEITQTIHSPIAVVSRNEPYFKSPFHYHPELELVYVKEGFGKRIIGEKLENFGNGDMVFIGSNLPHIWQNDDIFFKGIPSLKSSAIVAYFNKEVFAKDFYELKETAILNDLFERAQRGIRILGKTQNHVAKKMDELAEITGFERILLLLEILHTISTSKEVEYISRENSAATMHNGKGDRLSHVYKFVAENYSHDIRLEDIARVAHLTQPAFCRLFKQRTGKHFVEYLNEVRISKACKQLIESDFNISEIAFQSGYKTLSNFNKVFKNITSYSPKEYRKKIVSSE